MALWTLIVTSIAASIQACGPSLNSAPTSIFPFDDVRYEGMDLHDPNIALVGKTYVLTATSGFEFVPLWTSSDGTHWKFHGPILKQAPDWLRSAIPDHQSIWAPAPLAMADGLRIYYCASKRFGHNTSYIGFAECNKFDPEHPTSGWEDRGMLVASDEAKDNFNAIDPDVGVGPDGRQWMVYGSYWSGLYEIELDPISGGVKAGAKPVPVASNTHERGNPLEAPVIRYHNGYYYLMVTYGLAAQGVRSTYRTVVGRSKEPEGPFLGFDGTPMTEGGNAPLIKSSPPMFGPGGGNLFVDAKGTWWLVYHYYDGNRLWRPDTWGKPTMQVRRVEWLDDWPVPALPLGVELEHRRNETVVGTWTWQSDFGDTHDVTFERNGTVREGTRRGSYQMAGRLLTVRWNPSDTSATMEVDRLLVDETNQFFVGRNQIGMVVRGIRSDAKALKL